ncbi:DegT/DnrJ/EryC1/StrS aminotransferase family protein [uncultured Clostridium sp.]|uniref:DegT/DnrJ/EryC1/StrS family aminotransferase n=1 Tax=uncultured Clostridium sp. TaxID=59620 RepID=UPI0025DA6C26|nr:DegT/DnrJ/EryC1/StrS family aminotransferase [uncultured Clostridium sp.]
MQFRDLKKQYEALKPAIDSEIESVINNSAYISGPQVKEFEEKLAAYTGMKHCISCGNGTDALSMILMLWNVGPGDAVFVPDFTFFATGEVASFEGATPIFVDVDERTFNISPKKLEEAIETVKKEGKLTPKVVIPVDLFGLPADYPAIQKIADKYGLKILEDGAQGFGGRINGRPACSFGDAATTSFFPAKPLGCYGDGGAIFTNNDEDAGYLQSIRVHGKGDYKYDNVRIGWNSRLDTLQAAIMLPKLKAFEEYELDKVNESAAMYTSILKNFVVTPYIPADFLSSWAQYTIQLKTKEQRDGLSDFLKSEGIPTMVYYPKPMHKQGAFAGLKQYQECPVTEKLCDTVLSIPMHPYLEEVDITRITECIKSFFMKE